MLLHDASLHCQTAGTHSHANVAISYMCWDGSAISIDVCIDDVTCVCVGPVPPVRIPPGRGQTAGVQEEPPDQSGAGMGRELDPERPTTHRHNNNNNNNNNTVTMTTTADGIDGGNVT